MNQYCDIFNLHIQIAMTVWVIANITEVDDGDVIQQLFRRGGFVV